MRVVSVLAAVAWVYVLGWAMWWAALEEERRVKVTSRVRAWVRWCTMFVVLAGGVGGLVALAGRAWGW